MRIDHIVSTLALIGVATLGAGCVAHAQAGGYTEAEAPVVFASPPTLVEGFTHDEHGLVIRPKTLLEAIASLEGRWIFPDPLAVAVHAPSGTKTEDLVAQLANAGRRAEPVVGFNEVLAGLTQQLKPADRYRVRFTPRLSSP